MRTKTSIACAVIAAALIGYGCRESVGTKPKPVDPTPAAIIASLEHRYKVAEEQAMTYKSELDELKARPPQVVTETIRVRDDAEIARLTAELAALQKRPTAPADSEDPIDADEYDAAQKKSSCAAGNCQPAAYQMRRGLFGRWRR